ncbi:transpeptidase family protein [bacterium]|nr:transpeptidase family protein [bacterium]
MNFDPSGKTSMWRKKNNRRRIAARTARSPFEVRTLFVLGGFVLLMLVLLGRAFQLQILDHERWTKLAKQIQGKEELLTLRRGPILDRNGEALAFSFDLDSIYAEPKRIEDPAATAAALAKALGLPEDKLREKLSTDRWFAWVKRRVPPEESARVDGLGLTGVGRVKESSRRYPNGELAANILGFVGMDAEGLEGLEFKYDDALRGEAGHLYGERDAYGNMFFPDGVKFVNSTMGGSLRLTIDTKIQYFLEQALDEGYAATHAKRVLGIVMDPNTGEILALAQRPSFAPENGPKAPSDVRLNHTVTTVFEPGSTMKPFVIAGALEDRLVRPNDTIFCENGSMAVGSHIVHDAHHYGQLTVSQVVSKSSNIGTAKIAFQMGGERLHDWLSSFGMGHRTGIEIPGESPGILTDAGDWRKIHISNVAFGQGIAVSPLQMVSGLSALVNGGKLMRPYVVAEVRDSGGIVVERHNPQILRQVIAKETSWEITKMMADVTKEGGTGTRAALAGYTVAGKTGTAQKVDTVRKIYHPTARIASFMGAVPAEKPRIASIIVVDDPQGPQYMKYGGVAAAPIFRQMASRTMNYLDAGGTTTGPEPSLEKILKVAMAERTDAPEPAAVIEVAPRVTGEEVAPNLVGLTIRDVVQLAGRQNLRLSMIGTGIAVRQEPSPGHALGEDRKIRVTFDPNG